MANSLENVIEMAKALEGKEKKKQGEKPQFNGVPKYDKDGNLKGISPYKTQENLEILLEFLGIEVKYNKLKKEIEIKNPNYIAEHLANHIINIEDNNMVLGLNMNSKKIGERVNAIATEKRAYNPISLYLKECHKKYLEVGSNKDYIEELFSTLVLNEGIVGNNKEFYDNLFKKFFIQAVALPIINGDMATKFNEIKYISAELVLVLTSPKRGEESGQGIGKSYWLEHLVPKGMFTTESEFNPGDKDSQVKMTTHWITELGELGHCTNKHLQTLKAFITKSTDNIRLPYASEYITSPRLGLFVASADKQDFLKDDAGERRFLTIPIIDIDREKYNKIDIDLMWGQAYESFLQNNYCYKLNKEERNKLNNLNKNFKATDLLTETITQAYEPIESDNYAEVKRKDIITEITLLAKVLGYDMKLLGNSRDTRRFNNIFDALGFTKIYSSNGKEKKSNGYALCKATNIKAEHLEEVQKSIVLLNNERIMLLEGFDRVEKNHFK